MASISDTFLSGANAPYLVDLYRRYMDDPGSIDPSWASFFADLGDDGRVIADEARGASWGRRVDYDGGNGAGATVLEREAGRGEASPEEIRAATIDSVRALMLIRSYRVRGHLVAKFDPLGLEGLKYHPELDPKTYGFTEEDYDRPIFLDYVLGLETATLRQIMEILQETYCGSIGVEFMHIQEPGEKAWIQQRIESIRNQTQFTAEGKKTIFSRLTEAEEFEKFLNVKFTGTKRFGLDGGEAMIPALEQILKRGSQFGIEEVILGMAHRGRLNVLANIVNKPYVAILSEFQGNATRPDDVQGSGDVKYHLGTSADRVFDDSEIHVSLVANPSHLEAVDPVVVGKVRAKQAQRGDSERAKVMGVIIHGDAAIAGQGLAAEVFGLSELKGYRTGGTIHFIVNNQIGFTTSPSASRSSPYPSDVAKIVQAPIFHVNGDDPEAVVHVARIATEFRQEFKRDVVIDMFCYRRFGHNEADEPSFTQPIMYKAIAKHPSTREVYGKKLIDEGSATAEEVEQIRVEFRAKLEQAFEAASNFKPNKADWLQGKWAGLRTLTGEEEFRDDPTYASLDLLREVGRAISTPPKDFNVNRKILRLFDAKRKMLETGEGIDWAMGEALAYGTLLVEGIPVRLSGQDSGRGTFSHRHAVLVDQETEQRYVPLNHISQGQAQLEVIDSPLSEASVLGFEYGYSLVEPDALVLWEAQFGDFANGAQVIIDQFIAPGESKWLRLSGLVMLLPHGYEGQGPEHSSARPERYLQLCAEDNMQVVNCTTPANFFHALRRQICRNFRKPLIVMSPKSLLRHKLVVSRLDDMGPGTHFARVLPEVDALAADDKVRRLVLCTGKVYYDLLQDRRERGIDDVALVRVEQLYPWPRALVIEQLQKYSNAQLVWCQEEPANAGAWTFVLPRLINILEELKRDPILPTYVGRKASASPATGLFKIHEQEQRLLCEQALSVELDTIPQPFRRVAR
ncbi:MAG: 2-oxoglutarate dehydrogenase E1 component [Rhodospirillales bacterium]|jgi:2-oxoglutarate dehydrogenase E1 component|nr:2-oxoglutarate dehydrogenase E1 component [Rhodospirillales bacterium]